MKANIDTRKNSTWEELDVFLIDLDKNIHGFQKALDKNRHIAPIDTESLGDSINSFLSEGEGWTSQFLRKLKTKLGGLQGQIDEGRVQLHLATLDGQDEVKHYLKKINTLYGEMGELVLHSKDGLRKNLEAFQRSLLELKLWMDTEERR